jgi:four helix bundle protein
MNNFKSLKLYHKSLDLADRIYGITATFPRSEVFGLSSQMQRAAVSVGSNIAEGAARNSKQEFYHFLGITNGSAAELHFQLDLASRRNMISDKELQEVQELLTEIMKMSSSLQKTLSSEMRNFSRSTNTPSGGQINNSGKNELPH